MAYELHIERPRSGRESNQTPIAVEEWYTAVTVTDGVRLSAAECHSTTNPVTGEVISLGAREGDAEVYFPEDTN
jgi:hypothetical protein